jgi:threonine aldolase
MIDLRSDTVTLPTKHMMEAISSAHLGDDVYGEDPTAKALERRAAEMLGKQAAIFLPTGTMGNLCAMLTHCARGTRVVVGAESHIFLYEAGGASALGGLVLHAVPNTDDGGLEPAALALALESPDDAHVAPAGLLALENTQNRCGGVALDVARTSELVAAARARSIPVHLDGARIFNAAVALGVPAERLVESVDSVQLCFSKGLAAPVGSVLVGTAAFIRAAHRVRKMLGGGMRQVGVLAAPCLVALDEMIDRLADDHARARRLARGIREACGPGEHVPEPQTNIVLLRGPSLEGVAHALEAEGIKVGLMASDRLRAVTHYGIEDRDIELAVSAFERVLRARR